jgi:N-acyl-D-aspartate/D-glutamate deacylase
MQTRMRQIALGIGLILAAGCAGQQVTTDYSPATSFSQFKTFALVSAPDTTAAQQLLDQRVRNAVQAQLTTKGLALADR